MAAPKGNQFWKLRLKHGRDRVIKSPNKLWENACEYFEWCDNNPLIEVDFRGKDADRVEIPKRRVYQKDSLALACGLCEWRQIENLRDVSDDFSQVITRIEKVIRDQKFEGAAAGFLNARLIATDLGMANKIIIDTGRKTIDQMFPPEEELDQK